MMLSAGLSEYVLLHPSYDYDIGRLRLVRVDADPSKVKRTLRVFLSNTAHDQEWQRQQEVKPEGDDAAAPPQPKAVDMEHGKNTPGWVLRVEGRLLDVSSLISTSFASTKLTSPISPVTLDWTR